MKTTYVKTILSFAIGILIFLAVAFPSAKLLKTNSEYIEYLPLLIFGWCGAYLIFRAFLIFIFEICDSVAEAVKAHTVKGYSWRGSAACWTGEKRGMQHCSGCLDLECGDNTSPPMKCLCDCGHERGMHVRFDGDHPCRFCACEAYTEKVDHPNEGVQHEV